MSFFNFVRINYRKILLVVKPRTQSILPIIGSTYLVGASGVTTAAFFPNDLTVPSGLNLTYLHSAGVIPPPGKPKSYDVIA
jgi:hypothetical protein